MFVWKIDICLKNRDCAIKYTVLHDILWCMNGKWLIEINSDSLNYHCSYRIGKIILYMYLYCIISNIII